MKNHEATIPSLPPDGGIYHIQGDQTRKQENCTPATGLKPSRNSPPELKRIRRRI
ncbi:MAG: hypothetical protein HOP33_10495 [Verrucomicrobia bacterium]|nr:hypothetical protein [Verrucomicrobiota bacterium]